MAINRIQIIMMMIGFYLSHIVSCVSSTCYAQTCSTYASGCSTNANCICFQLVNGTGMCAAQSSTDDYLPCTSNLTCTDNSSICVVNSCFGQPLCYPLLYANSSTCPPSTETSVPLNAQATTKHQQPGGGNRSNDGRDISAAVIIDIVELNEMALVLSALAVIAVETGVVVVIIIILMCCIVKLC